MIADTIIKGVKWVWIDLDDTLVDFHANSNAALLRCYREWGLERLFHSEQAWLDAYHTHNDALWQLYNVGGITQEVLRMERFRRPLVEAGMPEDEARKACADLDPVYLDYLARGKVVIPGAHDVLRDLRAKGYKTGILSNGFNGVQQLKVKSAGMEDLIDLIVLSDEIGVNKPDTRLYAYAMERAADIDPAHHILIGDNPATDIAGALAAGWHAILFTRKPDLKHPTVPTIRHLSDINSYL